MSPSPRPLDPAAGVEVARLRPGGGKGSVGVPAPASTPEFLVKVLGERDKLDLVHEPPTGPSCASDWAEIIRRSGFQTQ